MCRSFCLGTWSEGPSHRPSSETNWPPVSYQKDYRNLTKPFLTLHEKSLRHTTSSCWMFAWPTMKCEWLSRVEHSWPNFETKPMVVYYQWCDRLLPMIYFYITTEYIIFICMAMAATCGGNNRNDELALHRMPLMNVGLMMSQCFSYCCPTGQ